MWNVKRAKTNNAKAKNDSEERDQSEANTENAEKTLNAYEHALECGNGARSFLSFFFAASFLFPSESFPLASFFFSFVVLRSCFRRANFFASSELGALVRLSRVFQVPPPRSVFCAREKKEGAWFTSSLLSSLFIFSLSLFLFLKTRATGLSFALKNSTGENSANFAPLIDLADRAIDEGIKKWANEEGTTPPIPPRLTACCGRVDRNGGVHECKSEKNTFDTSAHASVEDFVNGLAQNDKKDVVDVNACTKCSSLTFVKGKEKCQGLLCYERCVAGENHNIDKNGREICSRCTRAYNECQKRKLSPTKRTEWMQEKGGKGNAYDDDKFVQCKDKNGGFVSKERPIVRKLDPLYEGRYCIVCTRSFIEPVLSYHSKTQAWKKNVESEEMSKVLFPEWSRALRAREVVNSKLFPSALTGFVKPMKEFLEKNFGDKVQAPTTVDVCSDCMGKVMGIVTEAFKNANEREMKNAAKEEKDKKFFINAGAEALKNALMDDTTFAYTTPIPMEAGCSYGVGDPRRDNFIKYYRLPTRQGVSIVHIFQRTSSVTFGQKKRVDWTVEDAYEWARRVYADGRLVFPGLDANNKVPYDVWILPCYYIKYGSFLTSLLHHYKPKVGYADLPGFLDVINDINALTKANPFSVHTIFINSVADLTGSSDNLREALRLLEHPERVYIAWKMACGNKMNVNEDLGDTICVVDLLEFLSKQKHPEKTNENDDAGTEENDANEGEDKKSSIAKRIARKIAATFTWLMDFERTKPARGKDASKLRSKDSGFTAQLFSQLLKQKTTLLSERKICVAQWRDSPIVLTEKTVDSMRRNKQLFYNIKRRTMLVQDGTTSLQTPLTMVNNGGKKPKCGRKASR